MKPYRILTLGCKVNQCESAALGHLLEACDWRSAQGNEPPDVMIINTCTVTGKAAMQSRQAIRRAIRKYPAARIVVTGCYAQTAADEVNAIEGVDLIIGRDHKMRIAEILSHPVRSDEKRYTGPPAYASHAFCALPAVDSHERTRAFLKIQDGCNTCCTYCIVPSARGHSRSMPVEDVHTHFRQLAHVGIHEVVLTGIHLGAYGGDLQPPTDLAGLLAGLICKPPVDRLRLSSIEPTEISPRIVEMMQYPGQPLCRHFHIPLQSGDNHILRRMGRLYCREAFADTINDIARRVADVAIGLDVMIGFPGETDEAFMNTFRLIESLPISYLHVFPFSAREGTPAAVFKGKVPPAVIKDRCRKVRALGAEKKAMFYRNMVGRTLSVLIETAADGKTRPARGLSDNYIRVTIPDAQIQENILVNVRIERVEADGAVIGKVV
jgi:threonylcarbamoyladenosine tRNA methylthiotransferase MtaB